MNERTNGCRNKQTDKKKRKITVIK
jgi:hypothetical protein